MAVMCFSPLGKGGGAGCWQQVVLAQHFRMTKLLKVKEWWNLIWAAVNCENALITDFSHCHGKRLHPSFQQHPVQLSLCRALKLQEMGVTRIWCSSHPLPWLSSNQRQLDAVCSWVLNFHGAIQVMKPTSWDIMKSNSQLFPTTSMVLFCSWITLPTSSSPLKVVPVSVIFPSEQLPAQMSSPKDATGSVWCESGIPPAH